MSCSPPVIATEAPRLTRACARANGSGVAGRFDIVGLAALHLTALAVMAASEFELVPRLAFILTWSLLNFFWLALLRRPVLSAALSLALVIF